MSRALGVYAERAGAMIARYDQVTAEAVLAPVADLFPAPPAAVLDVGPGSGRDLAWLAAQGHEVTAAEPVAGFRAAIASKVPGARLVDARLPGLEGIDARFGMILANLVWHHISTEARDMAALRFADLLDPGGRLVLCLRNGPAIPDLDVWALDAGAEVARMDGAGFTLLRQCDAPPRGEAEARDGITATWLVLERRSE